MATGKHSAAAKKVFSIEAKAIADLSKQLTGAFDKCIERIKKTNSRVVVAGIGKSGSIAKKISATLASTGTPSLFLHPTEAIHGDLGMIHKSDILILISYSGETEELLRIIPFLKSQKNYIIAICGKKESTLGKNADAFLNVKVHKEACPLRLAPTSSTTATLAMGDAIAVALINARGFKEEEFARFHPGGTLGRKLLTTVADVMRTNALPMVVGTAKMKDVITVMSKGRLGIAVVHKNKYIIGIITDGDLRRAMNKHAAKIYHLSAKDIMTRSPKCVSPNMKMTEAEAMMNKFRITSMLVSASGKINGVVQLHSFQ